VLFDQQRAGRDQPAQNREGPSRCSAAEPEKNISRKRNPEKKKNGDDMPGLITIDDFFRARLKTAKVLEAEKIEGADKLLKLRVEVGDEIRQIVAGIALFYKPEELVGKMIVVVSNLKPAKIRGVESNGMLLAAKSTERLTLITLDADVPSGLPVG
jgi:methionyl-tRNA synthetase